MTKTMSHDEIIREERRLEEFHACATCGQKYVYDNPFWDGTDFAHPAWWRGESRGCQSTIEVV